MNKIILCFVFVLLSCIAAAKKTKLEQCREEHHPIIIVHGIMGSRIIGNGKIADNVEISNCGRELKEEKLWLSLKKGLFKKKCLRYYISAPYNPESNTWDHLEGLNIYPAPGVNSLRIDVPIFLSYMKGLLKELDNHGYVYGVDFLAQSYDWSQLPTDLWVEQMKASIEYLYKQNKNKKVIIVSHSMGCPFTYYFLMHMDKEWVEKYVHLFIPTAPAWMGAVKALKIMFMFHVHGDLVGSVGNFVEKERGNDLRDAEETDDPLTILCRNIPTTWLLLPWKDAYKDKVLVKTPGKSYNFDQIVDIFNSVADPNFNASGKLQSVRKYFDKYNNYEQMPSVNVLFAIGKGKETPIQLKFKKDLVQHNDPEEAWDEPEIVYGDGDGTVPYESLTYVSNKWEKSNKDKVLVKYFRETHLGILEDKRYINTIINFGCGTVFEDYDVNSSPHLISSVTVLLLTFMFFLFFI